MQPDVAARRLSGALRVAQNMMDSGHQGSIVSLMCDSGERYLDTYYDPIWVGENIGDVRKYLGNLNSWL